MARRIQVAEVLGFLLLVSTADVARPEPICVHPQNPHYYLFRGRPTVLVTSAEHYGAVINRAFDYSAYLDALKAHGLNYTRIYPAALVEAPGVFHLENTLAPAPGKLVQPWARSDTPGYRGGGNRFDLNRWDPDYFRRLKDFLAQADARDIVVEICFFNAQYRTAWPFSPMYRDNNIQGEGNFGYNDVQTLKHPQLIRRQDDFIRRIVEEVNSFDNVILEICDEPLSYGTKARLAGPWLQHHVQLIQRTESALPKKHLLGQQVQGRIDGPVDFSANPNVSVIVTQYIWETPDKQLGGLKALEKLYDRNKPIDLNETGYYPLSSWYNGDKAADVRVEGWEFMVGGGSSFNNLNGVFSVSDPSGKASENKPVLETMGNLKHFIDSFEFVKMRPDHNIVVSGLASGVHHHAMSEPGKQYALYHHHSKLKPYVYQAIPGPYRERIVLGLSAGSYRSEWIDPLTGASLGMESFEHSGGQRAFATPEHAVDIALRIKAQ